MGSKKKRKKQNIDKNSFIDTVLSVFAYHPFESFNFKQVSHALNIHDKPSRDLVKEMLNKLVDMGAIMAVKRGKYKLNSDYIAPGLTHSVIQGKVDMKQTGKAYIISNEVEQDVFIAPNNTNHALNGDEVKVQLFPKRKGRKLEGQITEILKRAKTEFVGNVEMNDKFAFLIPDVKNMPVDIYIPGEKINNVRDGDKAVARITNWPKHMNNPIGEIIEVLGEPGNNEVEMNSILSEFDFPLRFPQKVEKEAEGISGKVPPGEKKKRKDFREVFTCTIDPKDAKDFDDALSIRKLDNGNWEVGVHIADVSHYVKPGSAIDEEALKRATSVYLVDRVVPMLPEKLSNEVCSLRPDEDKLAFSAVFEMDEDAKVHSDWYGKTLIRSNRRYNYAEVQDIIETGEGENSREINVLQHLASILRDRRFKKGAINFKSSEVAFELDENGKPLSAHIKEQKESNQLIEEFMLLANRKVAERIGRKRGKQDPKTFIYRVHDEPNPDKLQQFTDFVNRLGYKMRLGSRSGLARSFNDLFRQVEGKGEEVMIETIAIRTMAKAEYSTQNIGHYGLAFNYYTHFTSPIRRYPDLMTHRLLQQYLEKKPSVNPQEFEEHCIHSSEMERKAIEAERASIKYKQAEYMLDKVGKEFEGLISGVSKWGIFVQLNETKAEGLVSMADMNDDFYILDDENYQVVGKRYKQVYKLGDPIRVKVKSIDLPKKQMDFLIV
ncbi:MAG: ribonuclease R [Bacteroidales bacterium]|nr:ribonuclease R [Bacteroidales bacterium]MCF8332895.1 ribonuclease R [Bacteroidales bacterium]